MTEHERQTRKAWRAKNAVKIRAQQKAWREANRERMLELNRESYRRHHADRLVRAEVYRNANKDKIKIRNAKYNKLWRKARYGVTREQFALMYAEQNGACAICLMAIVIDATTTHLDHCHRTGRNRGILCHSCNVAIGHLRDDADNAERAAAYLRMHA